MLMFAGNTAMYSATSPYDDSRRARDEQPEAEEDLERAADEDEGVGIGERARNDGDEARRAHEVQNADRGHREGDEDSGETANAFHHRFRSRAIATRMRANTSRASKIRSTTTRGMRGDYADAPGGASSP